VILVPRVIAITDDGLRDDVIVGASEQIVGAFDGRGIAIQLRARSRRGRALLALAQRLQAVCASAGALLLVNDRVDVALAVGAAGVHLGRGSVAVSDARRLLGAEALITCSAHTVDEVRARGVQGADAALLSPIFASPRKGAPQGTGFIAGAVARAPGVPVVALGGVEAANAASCLEAGAHGVAVVRALFAAADPADAARALAAICYP